MEKEVLLMFVLSRFEQGFDVLRESKLLIELLVTFTFLHSEHFQTAIPTDEFPSMP
jgi:hypothetical protein